MLKSCPESLDVQIFFSTGRPKKILVVQKFFSNNFLDVQKQKIKKKRSGRKPGTLIINFSGHGQGTGKIIN